MISMSRAVDLPSPFESFRWLHSTCKTIHKLCP